MRLLVAISLFALISIAYARQYEGGADFDEKTGNHATKNGGKGEHGVGHGHKHGGHKKCCPLICPKNSKFSARVCRCVCDKGFKAAGRTCKPQAITERVIKETCHDVKCHRGQKLVLASCKCVKSTKKGKPVKKTAKKHNHGHNIGSERESFE